MAYNATTIRVHHIDAGMFKKDAERLLKLLGNEKPEDCFLERVMNEEGAMHGGYVALRWISWRGPSSGATWEFFKAQVAPCVHGIVVASAIWEGGDSTSAFAIVDGAYQECTLQTVVVLPDGRKFSL